MSEPDRLSAERVAKARRPERARQPAPADVDGPAESADLRGAASAASILALQQSAGNAAIESIVARGVGRQGEPLAPDLRAGFERQLGHDLSGVRVHRDATAAQSAAELGANAYTVGGDVVVGAGRWSPDSPAGRQLLAHELVHVTQQASAGSAAGGLRMAPSTGAAEHQAARASHAMARPPDRPPTGGERPAGPTGAAHRPQGAVVHRQRRESAVEEQPAAAQQPAAVAADAVRELFEQALELYRAGRYDQAVVHFERVRHAPGLPTEVTRDVLFNIGMANIRMSRFATAILYFEQYLAADGADIETGQRRLAEAQRGAGVPVTSPVGGDSGEPAPAVGATPAASASPAASGVPPERARELFEQALELYQAGRYAQAVIQFERIRQTPGLPAEVQRDALFNIGMANIRMSRFATAILYFEQYLAADGADIETGQRRLAEAQRGAGVPVSGEGEPGEATEEPPPAQSSGEASPERVRQLFEQALSLHAAGSYRQAIITYARLRQVQGLEPRLAFAALFNMGMANMRLARYATAVQHFEQYLAWEGADVELGQRRLGEAQRAAGLPVTVEEGGSPAEGVGTAGEPAAAAATGEPASPERIREIFEQALALHGRGNYRQAVITYARLLQLPGLPPDIEGGALFNTGMANLRLSRFATAIVYFERYLASEGADLVLGRRRLAEAQRGAGLEVTAAAP